jgi:hypothetical protein
VLPKNWRSWVYVGSPLTPDGLNDSKEGFPEHSGKDRADGPRFLPTEVSTLMRLRTP